jgi:hypothetical protein
MSAVRAPSIDVANIGEADKVWDVEYTDEFGDWFAGLGAKEQEAVTARVELLAARGPSLGRPAVDTIHGSRHAHMKELRAELLIRILFAFDPRRTAILLLGGSKRGADHGLRWNDWYAVAVRRADDLYDEYLDELRAEGLI